MQDRLKYRVWDKEQKKYLPLVSRGDTVDTWITMDSTGVYLVERDNSTDITFFTDITDDVIVEICTGLKDKNGKLIFEGDILKDKYGALYSVSWNPKGYFETDTFALAGFIKTISEDMEVISNIYENPELLESKA